MRLILLLSTALASLLPAGAGAQSPVPGSTLPEICAALPVKDACDVIAEAARTLAPSYETDKKNAGEDAFRKLGYNVTYIPARHGWLQGTTDVFLASRPGSNRLFIVITGTESVRDWAENAKFGSYTNRYKDGQFYVPPGHAGFRRGMLNVVNDDVIRINEFDTNPLDCAGEARKRSRLSRHICEYGLPRSKGGIEAVLVGHSRGAGVAMIMATAFSGLEIVRPDDNGPVKVRRQNYWPLSLNAVITFAPPYAIYRRTDREAGLTVPEGLPDQWEILEQEGIPQKTISFVNEQDIVPLLSLGLGRQLGHRFRIARSGAVTYEGRDWGPDSDLKRAHSSHYYCGDVLAALGQTGRCPEAPEPLSGESP